MGILNKIFFRARNFYFNLLFFKKKPTVHGWPTLLDSPKNIFLGSNVQFNIGVVILAADKVTIGNDVVLSMDCKIIDTGLDIKKLVSNVYEHKNAPVSIGDNVWIGAGAIVLPGVTIGKYSVIGAGSVVVHDIPPYSMAAGNPAVVKYQISKENRGADLISVSNDENPPLNQNYCPRCDNVWHNTSRISYARELKWTPELVDKFWKRAGHFAVFHTTIYGNSITRKLKNFVPKKGHVIDYGGGPGNLTSVLLKKGYDVTLIDQCRESLSEANNTYGEDTSFLGAHHVDELDLVKKKSDVVMMIEVIEHMYDEQLEVALRNVRDLLTASGKVLITVPNDEDLASNQVYCPQCDHVWHKMQHVRKWDTSSLTAYLEKNGFVVERIITTHISPNINIFFSKRFFLGAILIMLKKLTFQNPPHIVAIAAKK